MKISQVGSDVAMCQSNMEKIKKDPESSQTNKSEQELPETHENGTF